MQTCRTSDHHTSQPAPLAHGLPLRSEEYSCSSTFTLQRRTRAGGLNPVKIYAHKCSFTPARPAVDIYKRFRNILDDSNGSSRWSRSAEPERRPQRPERPGVQPLRFSGSDVYTLTVIDSSTREARSSSVIQICKVQSSYAWASPIQSGEPPPVAPHEASYCVEYGTSSCAAFTLWQVKTAPSGSLQSKLT